MAMTADAVLAGALAGGSARIGQILVERAADGGWSLRHRADAGRANLRALTSSTDARGLALTDDAGEYRPLKTAPNLRRGWRLDLPDLPAVRRALESFYPAHLALEAARRARRLRPMSLRETFGRQSGMYRITGKITTEQAEALVAKTCRSDGGCLRAILWTVEPDGSPPRTLPAQKFDAAHDQAGAGEPVLPLLCTEPCALVVAAARDVVKKALAPQNPGGG